jgi:hypothetical protein
MLQKQILLNKEAIAPNKINNKLKRFNKQIPVIFTIEGYTVLCKRINYRLPVTIYHHQHTLNLYECIRMAATIF